MKRIVLCRVLLVAAGLAWWPAVQAQESAQATNQVLTLDALVDDALRQNPELLVAEASLAGLQGETITAEGKLQSRTGKYVMLCVHARKP